MAFPKEFEHCTACISLDDPKPTGSFISSPFPILVRQIGDTKWYLGVDVLRQRPELMEIQVASHESGWRYVLFRSEEKDVMIRKTFARDHLVEEVRWNINTDTLH